MGSWNFFRLQRGNSQAFSVVIMWLALEWNHGV